MPRTPGFTLVELLVTVAVAAILLALAVPGFGALVRSNRAEVQASSLVNSLGYARSEAVKRGVQVTVSPLAAGAPWNGGWRVWIDRNGDGAYAAGADDELQVLAAFSGDATLAPSAGAVIFDRIGNEAGLAIGATNTFAYRVGTFCRLGRDITVNHMGRISSRRINCP